MLTPEQLDQLQKQLQAAQRDESVSLLAIETNLKQPIVIPLGADERESLTGIKLTFGLQKEFQAVDDRLSRFTSAQREIANYVMNHWQYTLLWLSFGKDDRVKRYPFSSPHVRGLFTKPYTHWLNFQESTLLLFAASHASSAEVRRLGDYYEAYMLFVANYFRAQIQGVAECSLPKDSNQERRRLMSAAARYDAWKDSPSYIQAGDPRDEPAWIYPLGDILFAAKNLYQSDRPVTHWLRMLRKWQRESKGLRSVWTDGEAVYHVATGNRMKKVKLPPSGLGQQNG